MIGLREDANGVIANIEGGDSVNANFLISCSGLTADRTTKNLGIDTDFQIVPYRGEYYQLPAKRNDIVKHLIYPIPDPRSPIPDPRSPICRFWAYT